MSHVRRLCLVVNAFAFAQAGGHNFHNGWALPRRPRLDQYDELYLLFPSHFAAHTVLPFSPLGCNASVRQRLRPAVAKCGGFSTLCRFLPVCQTFGHFRIRLIQIDKMSGPLLARPFRIKDGQGAIGRRSRLLPLLP